MRTGESSFERESPAFTSPFSPKRLTSGSYFSLLMFFPCRAEWLRGRLPSQATLPFLQLSAPSASKHSKSRAMSDPVVHLSRVMVRPKTACRCYFSGCFLTALTHQAINPQKKSNVVLVVGLAPWLFQSQCWITQDDDIKRKLSVDSEWLLNLIWPFKGTVCNLCWSSGSSLDRKTTLSYDRSFVYLLYHPLIHNYLSLSGAVNSYKLLLSAMYIYPMAQRYTFTVSPSSCCCRFKYNCLLTLVYSCCCLAAPSQHGFRRFTSFIVSSALSV